MAKISHLYVVTSPTAYSTMEDICFRVELPFELAAMFDGGLKPHNILAFYTDKGSAEEKAEQALHRAKIDHKNKTKKLFVKMMEEE